MRKFLAILTVIRMLTGLVGALAEAASDESFSFTWDGEKLSGPIIVDGVEGFLEFYRVEAAEEENAE